MAELIRYFFESGLIRICPPWLRRRVGSALMRGLGLQIDVETDRNVDGLELRFPDGTQPDALAFIGRERRILRGPGEDSETFAVRLRGWWDAHRTRGNPHALLRQMRAYFLSSNPVDIEEIANSGTRHVINSATGAIVLDSVAGWTGDGLYPTKWARFFIFMDLGATLFLHVPLLTESGEPLTTEDGEGILVEVAISAFGDAERELICAVPREWSAAHIDKIYLGVVGLDGWLWGFPVGTEWGDPGLVWGSSGNASSFEC